MEEDGLEFGKSSITVYIFFLFFYFHLLEEILQFCGYLVLPLQDYFDLQFCVLSFLTLF